MKKAMLFLIVAFAFTGTSFANNNFPLLVYYIPPSLSQPYGFPVRVQGQYVVLPDKEEFKGWHTTCIGASFVDKEPKKLVPPVKKAEKPKIPPLLVVPTPPKVIEKPKPVVPVPVVLESINFDPNKTNITPLSSKALDKNGMVLKENPTIKVDIIGHTDNRGTESANQILSEKRAKSAYQYILDKFGISADRLKTKGYGSTKPIADNSTEEGRKQNRRVEFQIVK